MKDQPTAGGAVNMTAAPATLMIGINNHEATLDH